MHTNEFGSEYKLATSDTNHITSLYVKNSRLYVVATRMLDPDSAYIGSTGFGHINEFKWMKAGDVIFNTISNTMDDVTSDTEYADETFSPNYSSEDYSFSSSDTFNSDDVNLYYVSFLS